jgi:UPF0716 protein FxsA
MILFAFLLWPLLEIAAAFAVAQEIGVLWCLLALIAGVPAGTVLMRAEARVTLRRIRESLAAGRPPGDGALDGALGLGAGPLLILPGFITDAFALLLLIPFVQRALGRWLVRHARSRFVTRAAGFGRGAQRPYDVDGSAHETPPPPRPQLRG